MNVVKGFSELCKNDIEPMYKECFSSLRTTRNFKNKVVELLKTTDKVIRKVMVYYPKTILIGTIANVIFTVLFPTIGSFLSLAINCVCIFRHLDYMMISIKEYSHYKTSEWFSSYEEKKVLEVIIHGKILGNDLLDRIGSLFRRRI
ncbi:MAG: hypothetical protein KR126chlam4_00799 [Candidatus Anoxychlamydiales bacterium]|nr:hypothetical protein [Candidatus Anoxychlamydiales bacterium]NGX40967.1 hypothetical protein [Candidatus Anoxychlamydiales bacterium]HEU63861.1 hypothetical protein [Chlamydiota bacterium]